ncbi:MAG: hypothetical protein WC242_04005 [Candidatus Paceibacterota bacterium]|jgi:hypothetical protein
MDEEVMGVISSAIAGFGEQANIASNVARDKIAVKIIEELEDHGFLIVPAASSGSFLRKREKPPDSFVRDPSDIG